jgi:hypothetical protein
MFFQPLDQFDVFLLNSIVNQQLLLIFFNKFIIFNKITILNVNIYLCLIFFIIFFLTTSIYLRQLKLISSTL